MRRVQRRAPDFGRVADGYRGYHGRIPKLPVTHSPAWPAGQGGRVPLVGHLARFAGMIIGRSAQRLQVSASVQSCANRGGPHDAPVSDLSCGWEGAVTCN